MHFSNFLNFRPLNNSLERWIIFELAYPKGYFGNFGDFSRVSLDSRYSQKMALKAFQLPLLLSHAVFLMFPSLNYRLH